MKKSISIFFSIIIMIIMIGCSATFFPLGFGETEKNALSDSERQSIANENNDLYYENPLNQESEAARIKHQALVENSRKTPWMPGDESLPTEIDPNKTILFPVPVK